MFQKFNKEEVIKSLRAFFEKRDEIILAYLFGSVAEKRQNKLSDLDVAVLVEPKRLEELDKEPFGYQAAVMTDLMGLFHTNDVDVVILNNATPLLAHEVVKYGIVVFCRDEDKNVEYEVRTRHRYLDTKPLREIQNFYFKERIKKGLLSKVD
ncbi:MAG: nucleotidyltransferase domain-containing protein [bacterium]